MNTLPSTRLNGLCPYFTMFPLRFPLSVLGERTDKGDSVLDPFAGRGTTNYAARLLGLRSVGIDSSPVAVALTRAKLANASPSQIVARATELLEGPAPKELPEGEFWSLAFDPDVLQAICRIREGLISDCRSWASQALLGVALGALHGPATKGGASYFSNQCTRTYAPKPAYAVGYWKARELRPQRVDVQEVIRVRAERYYLGQRQAKGRVIHGDSRVPSTFAGMGGLRPTWVVTSPPFYGMKTYLPDQWLRNWFVGGPAGVVYSYEGQLGHRSPDAFANDLRLVWGNVAKVAAEGARLVVRFGGISDRNADPLTIAKESLRGSPWRLQTIKWAGSADAGRRQSGHFGTTKRHAKREYDLWARTA